MDQTAGMGTGLVGMVIAVFLIVMAILAFLLPLFVYQIKNEITRIRKTMDTLADELTIIREEREHKKKILAARTAAAKKKKKAGINKKSWDELKREEREQQL